MHCYHCGSTQTHKHGKTCSGKQRYQCGGRGRSIRENPDVLGYTEAEKAQILRAYQERTSLQGLTRIFGVSRNMVSAGFKKAQNLPPLEATLAPAQPLDILEAQCTMELRAPSRRRGVIRLRLGLCQRTRQIVADALGPRDDATARLLWDRIPLAYRRSPLYTDPLESDHKSLPTTQHHADYPKRGPTNHMERFNNRSLAKVRIALTSRA